MRISFEWQNEQKTEQLKNTYGSRGQTIHGGDGRIGTFGNKQTVLDISGKVTDDFGYGNQGGFNERVIQEVGAEEYMHLQRNFNAVMSNSMSGKDFMEMEKEGFDVYSMDPEEAVTILDKIKAELAKSGTQVEGYTDSLSTDKLEQITGSRAYANKIAKALKEADAPVTEENIRQIEAALTQAKALEKPGEGNLAYLAANSMEPTLGNLYKASYSSVNAAGGRGNTGYASGSYGRQGENLQDIRRTQVTDADIAKLESQLKQRVEESGMEASPENMDSAKWLMEKGLSVNKENIELVQTVQDLSFPLDEDILIRQGAQALAEGRSLQSISVTGETTSLYVQAASVYERYQQLPLEASDYAVSAKLSLNLVNMEGYARAEGSFVVQIQARKSLEEVRLKMTVEANLKLLQSGFSIDTAPMEELIVKLDEAARQWEESLFGSSSSLDGSVNKGDLYLQTLRQVEELPRMPVALAGKIPFMENPTLSRVGEEGRLLESRYKAAGESYETLMTAPRKDMGDSIAKAFRNVDDILQDMELELSKENQRAVRILGYNRMEITLENLQLVKEADRQVQDVIEGMKPGLTLDMIRQGKNPMEMTLDELQEYIQEKEGEFREDTGKYSKFLYKLEQQGNITADERKAYIGIYRLFHQIEKTDGAAIGSLIAQGADINLSNLLSAVRSRKAKPTDIRVDDSVGTLQDLKLKGISISAQIEEGFQGIRQSLQQGRSLEQLAEEMERIAGDKQLEEQYAEENLQEIRQILKEDGRQADYLKTYHQPATLDNLQSAGILNGERGKTFQKIRTWEEKFLARQESLAQEEKVFGFLEKAEQFVDKLDQPEERQEAYQSIIEEAGAALEGAVAGLGEEASYVDIKGIQQLYKQLHLASDLSGEENYEIPVRIGEEVTSINLKIIHRAEITGEVKITLETEKLGKVEARFRADLNFLEGSILTQHMDKKDILEAQAPLLTEAITEALEGTKIQLKGILFGENQKLNINHPEENEPVENPDTALLYRIAKEFIAFVRKI
ncbi:MAG: hypothetical protein IJP31_08055 [Lachnospiraceae bacterium]|nr:hypothetical protein [Lachnospiraceae bacterium]